RLRFYLLRALRTLSALCPENSAVSPTVKIRDGLLLSAVGCELSAAIFILSWCLQGGMLDCANSYFFLIFSIDPRTQKEYSFF
ncbi:MAG: hypothetical protein WAN25_11470, partial [Candidatus Acidiferrum sp.]